MKARLKIATMLKKIAEQFPGKLISDIKEETIVVEIEEGPQKPPLERLSATTPVQALQTLQKAIEAGVRNPSKLILLYTSHDLETDKSFGQLSVGCTRAEIVAMLEFAKLNELDSWKF